MRTLVTLFLAGISLMALSCDKTENITEEQGIPDTAVCLSGNGTANCYIVKPGTTVWFDASRKGCSKSETVGEISGCSLVWQSRKSLIGELSYSSKDKAVVASVSPYSGNAVVAVHDSQGRILWSWHLWITDYDPEAGLLSTPENGAGKSLQFMDRNLGALSTVCGDFKTSGMIYQWGRKDPFPSAETFTIMNEDYSYQKDGEPVVYDMDNNPLPAFRELSQSHGTLALSVMNPDVFYTVVKKDTGNKDENGNPVIEDDYRSCDWTDISDDDFWGGESLRKSIYDPCPPGYKVPVFDSEGNSPYAWLTYDAVTWDPTGLGCFYDGVLFPTTGTRAYASGGLDYTESFPYSGLWTGTKGKASDDLNAFPRLYGQYFFIKDGKRLFKVMKDMRSQGMSVRCVVE